MIYTLAITDLLSSAPLLAAGLEELIFKVGIWVVIILIMAYRAWREKAKAQQRQQQRRPAQRPMAQGQAPQARPLPPEAAQRRRAVDDEVAEFLRRAAERQASKPQAGAPQRGASQQAKRQQQQPAKPSRSTVSQTPLPSQTRQAKGGASQQQKRRVAPTVAPVQSTITAHQSTIQAHVAEVFDHKVGTLGDATPVAVEPEAVAEQARRPVTPTGAVAGALFRSPQDVRTAMILNEIINRPVHRW